MFYALIVICAITEPECDVERAIFAEQSPPIFRAADICFEAVKARIAHNWTAFGLKEDVEYHIEVTCTPAGQPA